MDLIHVETDELRSAGRACEAAHLDFEETLRGVRSAAYRLEANWQGGPAESFQYELETCLRTMAERLEEIGRFARVLARQAEGWEEIDQRWTGVLRGVVKHAPEEAVRA